MAFEVGHTINQGRTKPRAIYDEIVRSVQQNPAKLKAAIVAQIDAASEGDLSALDWIACRLEGKPAQAVTVSGDDERPLVSVIKTLIVYPDNDSNINSLRVIEGESGKENSPLESQASEGTPPLPLSVILGEGGGGEVGTIPSATNVEIELSTRNQDK